MKRDEQIKAIANKCNCSQKEADTIYKNFVSVISESILSGNEFELAGVGTLKIVERKGRTGINPQTKEPIIIPAKKAIKFKTCATINRKLNS